MYVAASNNRGVGNKFWYPAAENQYARFIWNVTATWRRS